MSNVINNIMLKEIRITITTNLVILGIWPGIKYERVALSGSKLRDVKNLRVLNKVSINGVFASPQMYVTTYRQKSCTLSRAWKHNDSSWFWFVALAHVYYILHTQGMRFSRARSARTQFFTFLRSSFTDAWKRRLALTGGVLSGTHRLGRTQRWPGKFSYKLHFHFVAKCMLQACEINCVVKARNGIFFSPYAIFSM